MKNIAYYFVRIWLFMFKRKHLTQLTHRSPELGYTFTGKLTLDATEYTFKYIGQGIWYSKDKPVKPIFFETLYI